MVDGNLVFIIDTVEKFQLCDLLLQTNIVYVFRTAVKLGETSIKFLSYKSCKFSGHIKVSCSETHLKYSELTILRQPDLSVL